MNEYIRSKLVYVLIGMTMLAMVIWIIAGTHESGRENNVPVNQETYTMESSLKGMSQEDSSYNNGYYMVKAESEIVRVFWIDETGEHLHRETTIAFPLLSLEDQKLLNEGIILENDEELARFLENYDS